MKVAIMGYGTIGSGVAEILEVNKEVVAKRSGEPLELKYVLDLRDFEGDPIADKIVHDYKIIAEDPEVSIVVETMGGVEPAYTFVKAMLEAGKHVTTSNKALVADKGAADAAVDDDLKAVVTGTFARVEEKMETLRVADALTEIFGIFKRCNKYIDETEPWVLAKDETKADRLSTVLYNLVEGIVIGASLLQPYMPETAEKIAKQLNTSLRDFDELEKFGLYPNGNKVTEQPEILFARLDMKEVAKKEEELEAAMLAAAEKEAAEEENESTVIDIEAKPEITYDDFAKLQFQVGEIIACEAVPKSKKLLCSQVKIGSQVKQIVSGIKAHYSPEEMVGKKVMVLVNLKPATLAGVLSEGMLLCAEDSEGNLALMKPEKEMPAGAEIC